MHSRDGPGSKMGAGHAAGMARQGLRELRAIIYPESNIAQPSDLGIYGNATPGEVDASRRSDELQQDIERWEQDGGSVVDERLRRAQATPPRDDQQREMDRE